MRCFSCGARFPMGKNRCLYCGQWRSREVYVPFWGVVGGVVGSLIGFTLWNVSGALLLGLIGIIACELGARFAFRASGKA
jgi:hypothetical protein